MKLKLTALSICLTLSTYAQNPIGSPPANNVNAQANAAWYRGGNLFGSTTPPGANIFGTMWNSAIFHQTAGVTRMQMNGTVSNAVNGGAILAKDGFIGIGNPSGFYNGNLGGQGPFSLLHLNGQNGMGTPQTGGYRDWMRYGITSTHNQDLMFMGQRATGGSDVTDAVIGWADNGANGFPGPDNMVFNFLAGSQAGGGSDLTGTASFGREVMRLTGYGNVGIGPRFNNNRQPQSTLHINQEDGSQSWLQISNQTNQTASYSSFRGLRMGIDGTSNAYLYNQENRHLLFGTNLSTANLAAERMRITAIGTPGTTNPGGIANNLTRVSISHNPTNPVTRPLSLLHLGYNTGAVSLNPNSTDGWRPWMDIGMFTSNGTDNVYLGLKNEPGLLGDRQDAVLSWGDNQTAGTLANGPDNFRFIFTSTTTGAGGTPPATGLDGLEALRMTPTAATGVFTGIGGNPIGNLYSTGTPTANNTLEVNSWGATTVPGGSSGLRFTNLNTTSPTLANPGTGVLSVDVNGDVIYVPSITGASLGNICGPATTNPLTNDWEIPLNAHNFVFSGQGTANYNVGIGTTCSPAAKLDVFQNSTNNNSIAVRILNLDLDESKAIDAFSHGDMGIKSVVKNVNNYSNPLFPYTVAVYGEATASNVNKGTIGVYGIAKYNALNNTGGVFVANTSGANGNQGVMAYAHNANDNLGGYFIAASSAGAPNNGNVGISTIAWGPSINPNIALQARVDINRPQDWAGWFEGEVYSTINFTTSDKNLKRDIQKISTPLDKIMKLQPSFFSYDITKAKSFGMNLPQGYSYGFIAQDLEQVFPELIKNTTSPLIFDSLTNVYLPQVNFKTINYDGMIGILAAGIQELNGKTEKSGLSDNQVKTNINNFNALAKVKTLNPVSYNFTNQNVPQLTFNNNLDYGFVAQQLETVYPELIDTVNIAATYDSLGNVANQAKTLKTVNYKAMSALLTRAIQEQQLVIDSLLTKQSKQDSINNRVQEQLAALAAQINGCCSNANNSARNADPNINQLDVELSDKDAIVLNQNVPNPFAEQTTITYNVPESVGKAQIIFYNANGQIIQTVDVKTRGKGKVNVFASDLSSGLYHYTLVADGKVVDSKKMVRE